MVGVPGRSKGCHTCRTRKKGCDLKRPICGQCLRMNLKCGGYERKMIFIPYQQETESAEEGPMAQKGSGLGLSARGLQRSAHEVQLVSHLWDEIFRRDNFDNRLLGRETAKSKTPWLHMLDWSISIEQMYRQDPMVKSALLAVSLGCYGRHYQIQSVQDEGTHQYSKALAQLSHALRNNNKPSDEVLATSKLFSVYEWLGFGACDELTRLASNWEHHNRGCASLLQARGPRGFESDQAYWLFAGVRHMVIVNAIKSRKKTFLADPDWTVLPWANRPKDMHQKLLDIAAELPTVLENFDVVKNPAGKLDERRDLCYGLISHSRRLDSALHQWHSLMLSQMQPEILRSIENGIPEDLPAESIAMASSVVQYWSVTISLYHVMRLAHQWIAENFPAMAILDLPALPAYADPHRSALAITNSTSYFFSGKVGALGPWAFCVPMAFALAYFDFACTDANEERGMLMQAFKTEMGPTIQKFLISVQAATSAALLISLVMYLIRRFGINLGVEEAMDAMGACNLKNDYCLGVRSHAWRGVAQAFDKL